MVKINLFKIPVVFLLICVVFSFKNANQGVYKVKESSTRFHSDARLELIKAESKKMQGALDITKKSFAFAVEISSFEGFNSPLQKEHFNENYMETKKYPKASFTGRIIEDSDFTKDGTYNIRAKGKLNVHGVEQERIIQVNLVSKAGVLKLQSKFSVQLADHDIKIPRIVHEKLASEIVVEMEATLTAK